MRATVAYPGRWAPPPQGTGPVRPGLTGPDCCPNRGSGRRRSCGKQCAPLLPASSRWYSGMPPTASEPRSGLSVGELPCRGGADRPPRRTGSRGRAIRPRPPDGRRGTPCHGTRPRTRSELQCSLGGGRGQQAEEWDGDESHLKDGSPTVTTRSGNGQPIASGPGLNRKLGVQLPR